MAMKPERRIANELHNPGCLRRVSPLFYIDETGQKKEIKFSKGRGGHTCFYSDQDGLNAMRLVIEERFNQQGKNSIQSIMHTYAPAYENNTKAYIRYLSRKLGVSPKQPLDLNNPKVVKELMKGIARYEGALVGTRYTDEMFDKALKCRSLSQGTPLKQRQVTTGQLATRRDSAAPKPPVAAKSAKVATPKPSVATKSAKVATPNPPVAAKQSSLAERSAKPVSDEAYERANARLTGKRYKGIKSKGRYRSSELARMKQNIKKLMEVGLLPQGDVEKQAVSLIYKTQQLNRLTDGRTQIAVDGKERTVNDYLSDNGGLTPNSLEKMLKSRNLSAADQFRLAQTLQCVNNVVKDTGEVSKSIQSAPQRANQASGVKETLRGFQFPLATFIPSMDGIGR